MWPHPLNSPTVGGGGRGNFCQNPKEQLLFFRETVPYNVIMYSEVMLKLDFDGTVLGWE